MVFKSYENALIEKFKSNRKIKPASIRKIKPASIGKIKPAAELDSLEKSVVANKQNDSNKSKSNVGMYIGIFFIILLLLGAAGFAAYKFMPTDKY
jgi:hypothetical protein